MKVTDLADVRAMENMTEEEKHVIEEVYGDPSITVIDHEADEKNYFTEHPRFSRFCNRRYLLVFLCFFVLVQSMVVTGLFSVCLFCCSKVQKLTLRLLARRLRQCALLSSHCSHSCLCLSVLFFSFSCSLPFFSLC